MTDRSFSAASLAAIALFSALALGLALIAQYGFDMMPCELCLAQRLAYGATLFLAVPALMPAVPPAARRQVVLLCAALFAVNAGLAAYHAGVEYGWWQGPTACTGATPSGNPGDLLAALNRPGRVACDQAAFRLFGVSMAGGNVIVCTLAALGCLRAAAKPRWSTP
jgi:disulfide bond formation protein DsbB